jgi:hypothetical protein
MPRKFSGAGQTDTIKHWESLTGLKQANGLIKGHSAGRSKELLDLNRNQLPLVLGLLTGHCHLKGHLSKWDLRKVPRKRSKGNTNSTRV